MASIDYDKFGLSDDEYNRARGRDLLKVSHPILYATVLNPHGI